MTTFNSCKFLVVLSLLHTCELSVSMVTRRDYERLHDYLVNKTGPVHLNPRYDKDIEVHLYMGIAAIQDYDEVSSILTVTAIFWVAWKDDSKKWDAMDYGNIERTNIPILDTWTPELKIQNGIDVFSLYAFDTTKTTVVVMNTGYVLATIGGRFRVICEPDMTFYPADEHKCTMIVVGLNNLLNISYQHDVILDGIFPHNEWFIKDTYTHGKALCSSQMPILPFDPCYSALEFTIILKRSYMFSLLNIIVPIVIVSFVHIFVFLLPIESGERTSFAFTLLLTLIVFMTKVTDNLPPSSDISVINMFLLHQLVASVLTTFLVVLSIQIYHKDPNDKNKGMAFSFASCLFRLTCSRRTVTVRNMTWDAKIEEAVPDDDGCREISSCFDKMCFRSQAFCYIASYVSFAIYILMFQKN